MKKSILLFTILCAGQLYGMEKEQDRYIGTGMGDLPLEVQSLIITHINTGDTLENVIRDIIRMSRTNTTINKLVNDLYGNLKGFTALVHVLANKFNKTPYDVASMFKTPIAAEYIKLGNQLVSSIRYGKKENVKLEDIMQIIKQGADIHFNAGRDWAPLESAIQTLELEIVRLLLNSGVKPNQYELNEAIRLEIFYEGAETENDKNATAILKLIVDAMKKQQ